MSEMWNKYYDYRELMPEKFPPATESCSTENERADRLGLGVLEEHSRWLWVREWDGAAVRERPVYLDEQTERRIEDYFALVERRPDLFAPSNLFPLRLDRRAMLSFMEKTGHQVGLVFDNGKYYKVVADLIEQEADRQEAPAADGGQHDEADDLTDAPQPYAYARVLYPDAQGNGTVIIPRLLRPGEEPLFGILHIFRHTIRRMAGGEFPRGFQAPGLTPRANACKELEEEFGIRTSQLTRLTLLGQTRADTGLKSGQAQVYLADLTGPLPQPSVGQEGIAAAEWISRTELLRRIREGEILDGYTQTATLLYLLDKSSQS